MSYQEQAVRGQLDRGYVVAGQCRILHIERGELPRMAVYALQSPAQRSNPYMTDRILIDGPHAVIGQPI